jgi:parallel beta-helix repeat protein
LATPAIASGQIVVNGGFESGTTGWAGTTGDIGSWGGERPYEGTHYAWICGNGSTATETLYQTVSIPGTASSATLSFYLHIDTAETTTVNAIDKLNVQVLNTSGTVLRTLATYSNLNKAAGFSLRSFDLSAFKGQTVRICFKGTEDSARQTSFVVDNVSLTTTVSAVAVSVGVSPTSAGLSAGSSRTFTATVSGSTNTAVTWSVDGVSSGNSTTGTISGLGSSITYVAPNAAGNHTLKATSAADPTKSGTASITVTVPVPVAVALTPDAATIAPGSNQTFTATVSGSTNTSVSWLVDGVTNGNAATGVISGSGNSVTYTAPSAIGSHTVKAVSVADPTKSDSTMVSISGGCAPAPTSSLVVSVRNYGAKGDGVTDDTAAIQSAMDVVGGTGGTLSIPDGTYLVNSTLNSNKGLLVRSNMTIKLSYGAVLKAIPNNSDTYAVLYLPRVSNVIIIGGTVEGERSKHSGTSGEYGMGIWVASSQHIVIEGVTVKECWGDGFFIGGSLGSQDVTLCNVVSDHNRRQGLSLEKADGVVIRHSTFKNTAGTSPEAGIDLEPESGETVNNVLIQGCTFTNNAGGGLQVCVAISNTGTAFTTNVVADGNVFTGNGLHAADGGSRGGIQVSNCAGNHFTNNLIQNNNGSGILLRDNANNTVLTGNTVSGTTGSSGDGIFVGSPCTGFTITSNTVTNNAGYGIYLYSGAAGSVSGNTLSGNGK